MTHCTTESAADRDLQLNAIVCFHGKGSNHPLDPYLREGFKHVFMAFPSGDYWLLFDGYKGVPHAQAIAHIGFDLGEFYAGQSGMTVLAYPRRIRPETKWPLALSNCVGAVKTLLGVSAPLAFTPWQLYKYLSNNGANPPLKGKSID
jgi:hypothetical protein